MNDNDKSRNRSTRSALQDGAAPPTCEELSAVTGINDEQLLKQLLTSGVTAASSAAIGLIPLVQVAWADGQLADQEQSAVLAAAKQRGLSLAAYEQLKTWLSEAPSDSLMASWREHTSAILSSLDDSARRAFIEALLVQTRAVAEAAGRIIGLGNPISAEEEQALAALQADLDAFL